MNFTTKRSVALGALALSMAAPAVAQNLRPEKSLYILPRVGISNYFGDYDDNPFNFDDFDVDIPYSGALELGYQFRPGLALGVSYQIANYPTVFSAQVRPEIEYLRRHQAFAKLRFTAGAERSKVAPFLELGAGGVAGLDDPASGGDPVYGYGPAVGVGLDIALTRRVFLMLGGYSHFVFPDGATDGNDQTPRPHQENFIADTPSFDVLSHLGLGLKVNFRLPFTAVDVLAIDGPAALQTGQTGSYSATTNDGLATAPVSYMWDFGDGSTAEGLMASHAFNTAGSYNVTFTASNSGSTDSASMTTVVTNPPVPAEVLTLASTPAAANLCLNQAVRFTTTGRGDAPVNYTWNFGDGATGTGMSPTHTYTRVGTFTVNATASNTSGSNSKTLAVTVRDCTPTPPLVVTCNLTELNSAYFERNSSTLTEQGRMRLMENVQALGGNCASARVNITGYASRGERDPQALSEARARSVMQFYTDNGIAGSRLMMEGRGMMGGSKKDDVNQYRRADSTPMR